jgi:LAO/AO transport system kinase
METINEQKTTFYNAPQIQELLDSTKKAVQNDEISPFCSSVIIEKYFEGKIIS